MVWMNTVIELSRLMTDNTEYAKLLSSIKIANTNLRRVLSPIQVAHKIQRLINEEGSEITYDILPLTKGNITTFTRLLKLPEKYHDAVIWGESNDLGVGFSAASHISTLHDENDQSLLFSETSKQSISEKDVLNIISFYKKQNIPLREIIEKTTSARPTIINEYLVVISISPNTQEKIKKDSQMMQTSSIELLKKGLKDKFGIKDVMDVQLKDKNIGIILDESEYRKYKRQISLLKLEYDKITDYILQ